MDVVEDLPERYGEIAVLEPGFANVEQGLAAAPAWVNAVRNASVLGLADETVRHGLYGVGLVGLLFEFQLHGLKRLDLAGWGQKLENLLHVDFYAIAAVAAVAEDSAERLAPGQLLDEFLADRRIEAGR